ncbi:uncharacterized protein LOC141907407 [Tubulanus polymorphus]|uniref:uncharacterized protein LOC141907407 n=1 Tax=Tubulanus polymorphus TaxID=672921 RepID=UPI003DA6A734
MFTRYLIFVMLLSGILHVATGHAWGGTGNESGLEDDDPSKITCKNGYKVMRCYCYPDKYDRCDGALVTDNGFACTAYHTMNVKKPVRAYVGCDPKDDHQVITSSLNANPVVTCPSGYTRAFCMYNYPGKHMDKKNNVVPKNIGSNGCGVSAPCSIGDGCVAQIICTK